MAEEATPGIGHNSDNSVAGERLRAFLERIERLEEEKKVLMEDIKEVYSEAKATGFDTKIMRKIIALRKMEREKRQYEQEMIDLYLSAIDGK